MRASSVQPPQPIPYQGSKRKIAGQILDLLPDRCERFVEPFAGSAAVAIAVASRSRGQRIWINDAHAALIALWRDIVDAPATLSAAYARLWHQQAGNERAFFDEVRQRFNEREAPADFLYLLARCVKASVRFNTRGEFNNSPDNRRKGANPTEMARRIQLASSLLRGRTEFTACNYTQVLAACDEGDVIYMDPPYQGVSGPTNRRYRPLFDHDEFCEELRRLNARGIDFAVSYDGRTGERRYGEPLPEHLQLHRTEIEVGRSTQSTLLGRTAETVESLYLSPGLLSALDERPPTTIAQPAMGL